MERPEYNVRWTVGKVSRGDHFNTIFQGRKVILGDISFNSTILYDHFIVSLVGSMWEQTHFSVTELVVSEENKVKVHI